MKTVTLWYPTTTVGGAQLLFARLGAAWALAFNGALHIVDYEDGFIRKYLDAQGVEARFSRYEPDVRIDLGATTLITALGELPAAQRSFVPNNATRLVAWSLHPFNVLALFVHGYAWRRLPTPLRGLTVQMCEPRRAVRAQKLLTEMSKAQALTSMDGVNTRFIRSIGFNLDEIPLLPVAMAPKTSPGEHCEPRCSVGWLGRVGHDKVHSIVATLELLSAFATERGTAFDYHVIGEGPAIRLLHERKWPGITIHFAGTLQGSELDQYAKRFLRCGFAMGTSILEFAFLGIPVAVTDYSTSRIKPTSLPLRWAHQLEEGSLGEVVCNSRQRSQIGPDDIVGVCKDDEQYERIGHACREHAIRHHSIQQVANRFDTLVNSTTFSLADLHRLMPTPPRALGPILAAAARLGG